MTIKDRDKDKATWDIQLLDSIQKHVSNSNKKWYPSQTTNYPLLLLPTNIEYKFKFVTEKWKKEKKNYCNKRKKKN